MVLAMTETEHDAVNPPSTDLTVIFAGPALSAVTLPFSTLATDLSLLSHITVLSSASDGETVAVRLPVSPSTRERDVGFTVIPVTLTACGSFSQAANKSRQIPDKNQINRFFIT